MAAHEENRETVLEEGATRSGEYGFGGDLSTTIDHGGIRQRHNGIRGDKHVPAGEELFEGVEVPPWKEQITFRALAVGGVLGAIFSLITHKLAFTVGIIPSFNIAAGLMGFFLLTLWNRVLSFFGMKTKPFTRQENTVIQTTVIACCGLAFTGGFSNSLLAMDRQSYENLLGQKGNLEQDIINPHLGRLILFMLLIGVIGIFSIVPLRRIMILDYKLTYPSGTATAVLINSFHTPLGADQAKKQVKLLGKYFSISFLWSCFKWFFSGRADACGFDNFPSLGLKAFDNRFYFDFSLSFIGVGMICSHIVNFSVLLGAIISWGLLWPLIGNQAGTWYPQGLKSYDFQGITGYRIFLAISLILGDGLYNFLKIIVLTTRSLYKHYKQRRSDLPLDGVQASKIEAVSLDEKKRNEIFKKDQIPLWLALAGYVTLAAISTAVVPQLYKPAKWYFILIAYLVAPVLGFCNSYGMGLTDWSLITTYGKLGLFIFASWGGSSGGGVIAGLVTATVMQTIVGASADLMQDFKTGYLTLSSPRSMFAAQIVGVLMGCVVSPATFWLYWNAFTIGDPNGQYKAPNGTIFRAMAIIGTEGFSALPKHCLQMCLGFFLLAVWINTLRDVVPKRFAKYIPIPMAMAIPFYIGAYFAIDMAIGSVILYIWQWRDSKKAEAYAPAVASGLICGDGIWTVPSAILALAKVNPPICMNFMATSSTPS